MDSLICLFTSTGFSYEVNFRILNCNRNRNISIERESKVRLESELKFRMLVLGDAEEAGQNRSVTNEPRWNTRVLSAIYIQN